MNFHEVQVEAALDMFWREIARSNPEITTGDLPPFVDTTFRSAALEAVRVWREMNEKGAHQ